MFKFSLKLLVGVEKSKKIQVIGVELTSHFSDKSDKVIPDTFNNHSSPRHPYPPARQDQRKGHI